MDADELQLKFEYQLRKCPADCLLAVAREFKVDDNEMQACNGDKKKLLRLIQAILDEDQEHLKQLMMSSLVYVPDEISTKLMKIIIERDEPKVPKKEEGAESLATLLKSLGIENNSTFRRELRITGNVGTTTGCITFISLCSQISEGKAKGYSEEEITMAIKKAISAGSELRTVLDAKQEMSLGQMLSFIRSFMKEKTATELFKDLSDVVQTENEDAHMFVLRAMEIREKIRVAPVERVQYSDTQIQDMFVHAIRTGLKDINVRSRLETMLVNDIDDDKLMSAINAVSMEENERMRKLSSAAAKCKKPVTSAQASATFQSTDATLMNTIKELSNEVKSLRGDVAELKKASNQQNNAQPSPNNAQPSYQRGCGYCRDEGRGESCRHCWRCGAGDHTAQYCRKSTQYSTTKTVK